MREFKKVLSLYGIDRLFYACPHDIYSGFYIFIDAINGRRFTISETVFNDTYILENVYMHDEIKKIVDIYLDYKEWRQISHRYIGPKRVLYSLLYKEKGKNYFVIGREYRIAYHKQIIDWLKEQESKGQILRGEQTTHPNKIDIDKRGRITCPIEDGDYLILRKSEEEIYLDILSKEDFKKQYEPM